MNEAPKGLEYYKTADEYVAAWREFVAPFEKALGVRAHAYDPGVAFKRTDGLTATTTRWTCPRGR
jgi:hypothetical protein